MNATIIEKKEKLQTPPFMFSFEIFNYNVYNIQVDVGSLSNVIPYSICKNINVIIVG